ncbi:hypothetical protein [Aquimarina sediminis]|nr:hypothetical protein [Aquimarina sediminis]
MKNIILNKLAAKINKIKDVDIALYVIAIAMGLMYVGWELGRVYARM